MRVNIDIGEPDIFNWNEAINWVKIWEKQKEKIEPNHMQWYKFIFCLVLLFFLFATCILYCVLFR